MADILVSVGFMVFVGLCVGCLWMLPMVIAHVRKLPTRKYVYVVTVLSLGFPVLWLGAIVYAFVAESAAGTK